VQIIEELTRKLKNKKSKTWKNQNPLDMEITPENCAELGIPNYFDVIKRPMTLVTINVRAVALVPRAYLSVLGHMDVSELARTGPCRTRCGRTGTGPCTSTSRTWS
jgi:hypothetical protein